MGILILSSMVLAAGLLRLAIVDGSCEPRRRPRPPLPSVRPLPARLA